MSEYINNALLPVMDAQPEVAKEWPEWLTVGQAVEYTGASDAALLIRFRAGMVVREHGGKRARYWKTSLEGMRKAFGGGR